MKRSEVKILTMLLILFAFRIFAQLIQFVYPVSWLPSFQAWHSATLPYWFLVISQFVILGMQVVVVCNIIKGTSVYSVKRGRFYMMAGSIYFIGMLFRLIYGQIVLPENSWLAAWLPAIFHMVLALFVIVNGIVHVQSKAQNRLSL